MSLSLTCDCGARFEVEDTLAGQTVACPECQEPIKAPAAQRPPLRTSAFALASVICALVGAFTIVGTIAAVVLGVIAVVTITRQRDRLAGLGFAAFGIVAGVLFTGLTAFAFSKKEVFGMGNWARAQALAPIVDNSGPLEVARPAFAITRPAETWGVLTGQPKDPLLKALDNKSDLALVEMLTYAFIDVKIDTFRGRDLAAYQQQLVSDLNPRRNVNPFGDPDDSSPPSVINKAVVIRDKDVSATKGPGFTEREVVLEVTSGRQTWTMLVHLYQKGQTVYVVRCYVPKSHFAHVETDFNKALDSFTVTRK
jgi:hypothetical protein